MNAISQSLSVLLIEDNPTDVLLIREAFNAVEQCEYEFENSITLERGIERLSEGLVDVVILDLGLPDSRGVGSYTKLSEKFPEQLILVMTGLNNLDASLSTLRGGAQDYLLKNEISSAYLHRSIQFALERQRLNLDLRRTTERLRKLTTRLEHVREDERKRFSREIHDGMGQRLTALKMDIDWLSKQLHKLPESSVRDDMAGRMRDSEVLVNETIGLVRDIAIELRPAVLDHLGIADAIRDETRRFEGRLDVSFQLDLEEDIDSHNPEAETALFRIYQELLTNVARHAKASEVTVSLAIDGANLIMKVADNGVGMAPPSLELDSSLGILGMHERIKSLDGDIHYDSQPGEGTRITVSVPHKG